jgi:hypothetical protein
MIRLSLNLSDLPISEFIEKCRTIVTAMTGNASFATPNPSLTDITDALDALEATYQLGLRGDHDAKELQIVQRDDANALMVQLKTYVENTSGDDVAVAQSSGIDLRKSPERHNTVDVPQNVRAAASTNQGEGRISWDGVRNRKKYLVYSTTDFADINNQTKWKLEATTGQRFIAVSGLTSGTRYAFFVVSLGSREVQSEASDPAIMMAA